MRRGDNYSGARWAHSTGRLCGASGNVYDCAEDTTELRCPGCGRMKKVTPQRTTADPYGSGMGPGFSSAIHGRIWRARIPQHRR